jgi:hypothetical protein
MPELLYVVCGLILGYGLYPTVSLLFIKYDPSSINIQVLNAFAQMGILVAALLGLRQLNLSRGQSAITELRGFADLLSDWDVLLVDLKKKGYKTDVVELKDYTLAELTTLPDAEVIRMKAPYEFFSKNLDEEAKIKRLMNKLEIISAVFVKGIGSVDVVSETIAVAFCLFVETNAILYIRERHGAYMLYKNTISLYQLLKPIYGSQKHQMEELNKFIEEHFSNNKK